MSTVKCYATTCQNSTGMAPLKASFMIRVAQIPVKQPPAYSWAKKAT